MADYKEILHSITHEQGYFLEIHTYVLLSVTRAFDRCM